MLFYKNLLNIKQNWTGHEKCNFWRWSF